MHLPKAKKAVATVAAIAGCAVLPASALAASGSVTASANPGGALGCGMSNNFTPGFPGTTVQIAWSPNISLNSPFNEASINSLLASDGIPGRVSSPSGVLTLVTVAGGHC
jgi:hypothetical protein